MFVDREGKGPPNAGVFLQSRWIFYPVQAGAPAAPEIAVEGYPEPWLDVVAEVPFEGKYGILPLNVNSRRKLVPGKELVIFRVEPQPRVGIEDPMSPTARKTNLGLEPPTVGTIVDELCRIVLAGWSNHTDTDSDQDLLFPTAKVDCVHCRTTEQVDGKAVGRIE